jgi:hypothetical protein
MKLIIEEAAEYQFITEAKEDGSKDLFIEGIFLQSAIKNRNGRIYPEEVMDKEVARYIKETVDRRTAFGELDHPAEPSVKLTRASHLITSLVKEGTNYIGRAKIMDTPNGKTARALIESGAQLGVSSRALGTLKANKAGINEVQADFRLMTAADIVGDPSAPDAWVRGIMENLEYFFDESGALNTVDIAAKAQETLKKMSLSEIQEKKVAMFENYLSALSKLPYS